MLTQFLRQSLNVSPDLLKSELYDDIRFCPAFIKDINNYGSELIIKRPLNARMQIYLLLL